MKRSIILALGLLFAGVANAQTTYQVRILEDAPEKAHSDFLAIDVMAADLDFDIRSAGIYVGVNGRKSISDKLTVEGKFQPTLLNLAGKGLGLHTEGGVYFPMISRQKVDEVPVVLKYTAFAGEDEEGRTYDESKYINVTGNYLTKTGVRGGYYFKKSGYESDNFDPIETSMILTGVYAGFQKTKQALVTCRIDDKFDRTGAGFTRMYADFLFLPLRTIVDSTARAAADKDRFWGVRAGLQWYLDPHDGEYKRLGRSIFGAEIGLRPYTGFYIDMSWSFAILNW